MPSHIDEALITQSRSTGGGGGTSQINGGCLLKLEGVISWAQVLVTCCMGDSFES